MERLFQFIIQSKALKQFGVAAGMVFLVVYLCPVSIRKYVLGLFCGVFLIVAAYNVFLKGMSKRKSLSFEKGLQKDVGSSKEGKISSRKAQSEIADRWKGSVVELKKAGMDLYTLPWYLLIGEPQSGKSTTLKNSGLEFPVGTEALSGAGGTRNCDWWFTNEAVILDTAGRFTFQEQNAPDAAEWKTFLKLLKKDRARCPVNGVIMVIPCSSLLGDTDEQREAKALNLREKLTQLQRELEVQFPVFVLITKADQILGFTEFFSRLPATDQRQILGWSMPGPFIQAYDPAKFNGVFDAFCTRIHKLRLKLLGEDMSLTEVDKLYVFPEEMRALREPLNEYFKTIFVKTHYLPALFFRGFYFTSGLQEGKPIAKACAALIRNAGPGGDELIENLAKTFARSKAFFIRDFYTDKLFQEKNMVVHSVSKMGVNKKLGIVAIVGSILLILATGGFMAWKIYSIKGELADIHTLAQQVKKEFVHSVEDDKGIPAKDALGDLYIKTAEALDTSAKFNEKATTFVAKVGELQPELRDMHWMYFVRNVLHQQSRALYRQMKDHEAGASLAAGEAQTLYNTYIPLWSLNDEWVNFTSVRRSSTRPFKDAKSIEWGSLVTYGTEPAQRESAVKHVDRSEIKSPDDLKILFNKELDSVTKQLQEELDFSDKLVADGDGWSTSSKDWSLNPPIKLDLVYGELNPELNEIIEREIAYIQSKLKPPTPETFDNIVARANNFKKVFGELAGKLVAETCGYENPQTSNPFEQSQKAATDILAAYDELRKFLKDNAGSLSSFTKSPEDIKKEFQSISWVAKATGAPREKLDKLISDKVDAVVKDYEEKKASYQKRLEEIRALVSSTGNLALSAGAEHLLIGVEKMKNLTEAQNKQIQALSGEARPASNDAAEKALDTWKAAAARVEANQWSTTSITVAAGAEGAAYGEWKPQITTLAQTIQTIIKEGDEAVLVEGKLQFALHKAPGTLLKDSQISGAQIASDPPAGATAASLKASEAEAKALVDLLKALKAECRLSRNRLDAGIKNIESVKKLNRDRFLAYWQKGYESWEPLGWISPIKTWGEFQAEKLIAQPGNLPNRVKGDLKYFADNLRAFRQLEDASLGKVEDLYQQLDRYITSGGQMDENLTQFTRTVTQMSPDRLKAYTELDANWDKLSSVGAIAGVGPKFSGYPSKVRSLLDDVEGLFRQALAEFLKQWEPKLKGKFPFEPDLALVSEKVDKNVRNFTLPQTTTVDFKDYYLSEKGLDAFLAKYKSYYDTWSKRQGNEKIKAFFDHSVELKAFFLEGDQFRKQKVGATYTKFDLDEGRKAKVKDFQSYALRKDLHLPGIPDQRWTGREPGLEKRTYEWAPSDYKEGENFHLKTTYSEERGEALGGLGNTAEQAVPGQFSPLAYVYLYDDNAPTNGRKNWNKVLFTPYPDNGRLSRDLYALTFDFELDRPLPELPDWNSIKSWMQAPQ